MSSTTIRYSGVPENSHSSDFTSDTAAYTGELRTTGSGRSAEATRSNRGRDSGSTTGSERAGPAASADRDRDSALTTRFRDAAARAAATAEADAVSAFVSGFSPGKAGPTSDDPRHNREYPHSKNPGLFSEPDGFYDWASRRLFLADGSPDPMMPGAYRYQTRPDLCDLDAADDDPSSPRYEPDHLRHKPGDDWLIDSSRPYDVLDPGPFGAPGWFPDRRTGRHRRDELPDPIPWWEIEEEPEKREWAEHAEALFDRRTRIARAREAAEPAEASESVAGQEECDRSESEHGDDSARQSWSSGPAQAGDGATQPRKSHFSRDSDRDEDDLPPGPSSGSGRRPSLPITPDPSPPAPRGPQRPRFWSDTGAESVDRRAFTMQASAARSTAAQSASQASATQAAATQSATQASANRATTAQPAKQCSATRSTAAQSAAQAPVTQGPATRSTAAQSVSPDSTSHTAAPPGLLDQPFRFGKLREDAWEQFMIKSAELAAAHLPPPRQRSSALDRESGPVLRPWIALVRWLIALIRGARTAQRTQSAPSSPPESRKPSPRPKPGSLMAQALRGAQTARATRPDPADTERHWRDQPRQERPHTDQTSPFITDWERQFDHRRGFTGFAQHTESLAGRAVTGLTGHVGGDLTGGAAWA